MADEQPSNLVAFANAPGMITLTWDHSGDDVYWFVIEQESPFPGPRISTSEAGR